MNKHFHEEVTYDSQKERWDGLLPILIIPAFVLLVGWGVFSTFSLPDKRYDTFSPKNNGKIDVGVGGGVKISTTPITSPTSSDKKEKSEYLYTLP